MKKSVEVVKEEVQNSLGSLFTKEDVIKVVDSIETTSGEVNMEGIDEHFENLTNLIEQIESDIDDFDVDDENVEFGLDGNRIYVEHVDLDKSSIYTTIRELKEQIKELKNMFVVS